MSRKGSVKHVIRRHGQATVPRKKLEGLSVDTEPNLSVGIWLLPKSCWMTKKLFSEVFRTRVHDTSGQLYSGQTTMREYFVQFWGSKFKRLDTDSPRYHLGLKPGHKETGWGLRDVWQGEAITECEGQGYGHPQALDGLFCGGRTGPTPLITQNRPGQKL